MPRQASPSSRRPDHRPSRGTSSAYDRERNPELPSRMLAYKLDRVLERIVDYLHHSPCPTAKVLSPRIPNL